MPAARVAVTVALLVFLPAAPAAAVTFGVSDQQAANLADPRLTSLPIDDARLVAPWDAALSVPPETAAWLDQAGQRHLKPLVAFGHAAGDRCPGQPCTLPSVAEYRDAVAAFRARWPNVREFTPWNEPNHPGEPTAFAPARAAAFHDALRSDCPACHVVAGDMVDSASMKPWTRDYRAALQTTPQAWSLHNYGDVTYDRPSYTEWLLNLVEEPLWITETGGIVRLSSDGIDVLPYDEQRAAASMRKALSLIDAHPGRIARAYIYHWRAAESASFDSALVGIDGSDRPSLQVVRQRLGERRRPPPGTPGSPGPGSAAGDGGARTSANRVGVTRPRTGTRRPRRIRSGWQVRVRCLAGRSRCRGRVTLSASRGANRARIRLGSAPFALNSRAWRSVTVRVTPRVLRRARMLGRWSLVATIVTRDPPRMTERAWLYMPPRTRQATR